MKSSLYSGACVAMLVLVVMSARAADSGLSADIDRLADGVDSKVIGHRRHLHQHPELGNRETQTSKYVAGELRRLGYDVQTGVAHTGVIGVLRGGRAGPVVAIRADMDALPVVEEVDLPFASKVRTTYDGKDVGVMHACGHDGHTAILLGVAEVAAGLRDKWPGTLKLIFQPAEEGAPLGEEGGGALMVKEGVMSSAPVPAVIFGLHILSTFEADQIAWRSGGAMASADDMVITVHGKQTHGAAPWLGIDPIVISAQIVLGLQTIASRQMDATLAPVIITVGKIDGGVRNNIIPDSVTMKGTVRALDDGMRKDLQLRVRRTVEDIAASAGGSAEVVFGRETAYPVTFNNPELTAAMLPTLRRVAGDGKLVEARPILGAEDFSFFAEKVPGLYVFIGGRTPGSNPADWPYNHSPRFRFDETTLKLGVRTLANLAADYGAAHPPAP